MSAFIELHIQRNRNVKSSYVPMLNYVSLVVVIVVHYVLDLKRSSMLTTNQDFHTQMLHKELAQQARSKIFSNLVQM